MLFQLFSNIILSACFCCVGEIDEDEDREFKHHHHRHHREHERFEEEHCCGSPFLKFDVLGVLSRTHVRMFHPLCRERSLSERVDHRFHHHPFVLAAEEGDLGLVKRLFRDVIRSDCFFGREIIERACLRAAARGHFEVFEFLFKRVLHEKTHFIDHELLRDCSICAASHGHKNILTFLFREVFPESSFFIDTELLISCAICAAAHGQQKVLKFLVKEAFPDNFLFFEHHAINCCAIAAAAHNHADVLRFLFVKVIPHTFSLGRDIFNNSLITAAAHGRLESLHFLLKLAKHRWFLEEEVINHCCLFASKHGHHEVAGCFARDVRFTENRSHHHLRHECN